MDKAPAARTFCLFVFLNGFRSSDRRQYSGSLLRNLGLILLIIIRDTSCWEAIGLGLVIYATGADRLDFKTTQKLRI